MTRSLTTTEAGTNSAAQPTPSPSARAGTSRAISALTMAGRLAPAICDRHRAITRRVRVRYRAAMGLGVSEAAVVVAALSLAFVGATALVGRRELRAFLPVAPAALGEPLVVVIPARNEEGRLPLHLAWILREQSAGLRVVVVDDRSTDSTAARVAEIAARDPRVSLVRLDDDPPAGVYGKPRALHAAVA